MGLWEKNLSMEEYIKIACGTSYDITHFLILLQNLDAKDDKKLLFAVTGFRRLLSRPDPPIQSVIDANILPRLLAFIARVDFPRLQFEALWCLTNVASGNQDQVQVLVEKGAISIFIDLLQAT